MNADESLVARLVRVQFPQWAGLPVARVSVDGWDHRNFRLGDSMVVRLPSAAEYAAQVPKEHRWLPVLAPRLPFEIPRPIALGQPDLGYPWPWSVRHWIEGETAAAATVPDPSAFAGDIADFILALHAIDPRGGPLPGRGNFFRGGDLAHYDVEARAAFERLRESIDVNAAVRIWEAALASPWNRSPVWVHGDVAAGNLIVRNGRLAGVIDFGAAAVGDPACDLAIAWTLFRGGARRAFRERLAVDPGTWARGRGWALWKAAIVVAEMCDTNAVEKSQAMGTLQEVLAGEDPANVRHVVWR